MFWQTFETEQVSGDVQEPQVSVPPHPSLMEPQFLPCAAHVVGVHDTAPQTLAVPAPPHACSEVQVPQLSEPPQPSLIAPQFLPWLAQVTGVHAPAGAGVAQSTGHEIDVSCPTAQTPSPHVASAPCT